MLKNLRGIYAFYPVLYMFITVFFLREQVQYFYLASAVLIVLMFGLLHGQKFKDEKVLAVWLVVLAAIGLTAATILSVEKVELLINPQRVTSCSVSPIVTCSPIIASPQASAFGLPNSFIGIFAFAAVLAAGMTILAGAQKLSRAWWLTLLAGSVFGVIFSTWLFHAGVYQIGSLCLYCMSVWLVSYAIFWVTLAHVISSKHLSFGKGLDKFLVNNKYELLVVSYFVIFSALFLRWSDYWTSLF